MNVSLNRRAGGAKTGQRKRYKTKDLYVCFALNRLARDLDIDVNTLGFESGLDMLLLRQRGITKLEISHEIRTNHVQTEKLLEALVSKGLATVEGCGKAYRVKITREGLMFVHRFNGFYATEYGEIINEHYRYVGLPAWFRAVA